MLVPSHIYPPNFLLEQIIINYNTWILLESKRLKDSVIQ